MTFNSFGYAALLAAAVALHWALPHRYRSTLLVITSWAFYAAWDPRFLSLLIASTLIDYSVAHAIARNDDETARRRWLATSVVANLGMLGIFKYYGFFATSFAALLETAGLGASLPVLQVVLPVGISFYTFQTLSYTVGVYRREIEPTRNIVEFATFVAFFPQLVAGPIERAQDLLPQIGRHRTVPRAETFASGIGLIVLGLTRKVVIADMLAPLVADGFAGTDPTGTAQLLAIYGFALQIYGDFAGYTDIARGSARLLGIELRENFRAPYLSTSITEFWQRWHMSLSSWLRDHLYIPLGGNRHSPSRTYVNLMTVMVLGGLWHGAATTFLIWGAIHGAMLAFERATGIDRSRTSRLGKLAGGILTFHVVVATFAVFRADSLTQALDVLRAAAGAELASVDPAAAILVGLAAAATLLLDLAQRHAGWGRHPFVAVSPATRGVALGLCTAAIVVCSGATPVPFVYFQF